LQDNSDLKASEKTEKSEQAEKKKSIRSRLGGYAEEESASKKKTDPDWMKKKVDQ